MFMSGSLFNNLPIKKALQHMAKTTKMPSKIAYSSLVGALAVNGMDTSGALSFVAQPPAAPVSPSVLPVITAATTTAATLTAAALTVVSVNSPPIFTETGICTDSNEYVSSEVEICASIDAPLSEIEEVYIVDENSVRTEGVESEQTEGRFTFTVNKNGVYTIYASASNNQVASTTVTIDCIDDTQPKISDYSYDADNSLLEIFVIDEKSGVNFDTVYIMSSGEEKIFPTGMDIELGKLDFNVPKGDYILYISDEVGTQGVYSVSIKQN